MQLYDLLSNFNPLMIMMKKTVFPLVLMALLGAFTAVQAQESDQLAAPVTRTFVLKNATVVQKPGQVIQSGMVLVKDGLIQEVGKTVSIPADAQVIDADSMYVYAGFIDGLSNTGIPRPEQPQGPGQGGGGGRGQQQRPSYDTGNPPNEVAGITPEHKAKDLIKANDKAIDELRKAGFTISNVVPRGNMLPGNGALILLSGDSPDKMVLRDNVAFFSQLNGAFRAYPATVIGVMAKYRELYKQAEQEKAHEAAYQKNPSGMARPEYDPVLQAFYPVIDKKEQVFFAAPDVKSIYRIFTLQNDLKFPLVLADVKQGWYVADKIKAANVPVFLTLDLPKEKKKDDKKKADKNKEMSITDKEMESLEKRSVEEMKQHFMQAATFEKNGIEFGFAALSAKTGEIKDNLRKMVQNGLSENTALAALTTTPAKLLGISNIAGTVEKGKLANLVVTDKPYFADKSNVRYVFVDGTMYEYTAPAPRKQGDANAPMAKVNGKWNYTLDMGGQASNGTINLKDEGGSISGTISNPQTGQDGDIKNAVLSGKNLTFTVSYDMGGRSINVEFDLEFTGSEFEGTASVGQYGSFKITGAKGPGN